MRGLFEDVLHILTHVELREHFVALVEHKVLDLIELHDALLDGELHHASGRADDDVGAVVLEEVAVLPDGHAAVKDGALDVLEVLGEPLVLVVNLKGEPWVWQHNDSDLASDGIQLVERREDKDGSLAHTRLGLADDIHSQDSLGDAFVLNFTVLVCRSR